MAGCLYNRFFPSESSYFMILGLLTQYGFQMQISNPKFPLDSVNSLGWEEHSPHPHLPCMYVEDLALTIISGWPAAWPFKGLL